MKSGWLYIVLFVLSAVLVVHTKTYSQYTPTPSIDNLSEVRVDDLTDEQIQEFIDRVEESGLSQQQLEILAKQRGMSSAEIAKLRTRIFNVKSGMSDGDQRGGDGISRLRDEPIREETADQFAFFELLSLPDSLRLDEGVQVFGLSIFRNPNISFQPNVNIPTPQNYVLGPGDEVIIDIWGASEESYRETISPDGNVVLNSVGPIYLSGLTIKEATERAKSKLSTIYRGLISSNGQSPNTYMQFSLGQLRSIRVIVLGEVVLPGVYAVSSFSSLVNALYYAGGPTKNGTLREITVLRNGKVVKEVDLYESLIYGRIPSQFRLTDQDVVMVKPFLNRVTIKGQIKRPGIYEIKTGETLKELLDFAGGFAEAAYSSIINVQRNSQTGREVKSVIKDDFNSFTIQNGDLIEIPEINSQFTNRVIVEGAVMQPGTYEFKENSLTEVIQLAGGLRADAFKSRVLVLRQEEDLRLTSISVNLNDVMADQGKDLQIKNEDYIKVSSIFDISETRTVSIEGEVINPGVYSFASNLSIEDLITLAGGLKESASKSSVEVARRITQESTDFTSISEIYTFEIDKSLGLQDNANQFKLQPFDLVIVRRSASYEEQVMVEVEGEVVYPGKYALGKRVERISDLLVRAGGLTPFAYPSGATLIRRTEFWKSDEQKEKERLAAEKKEKRDFDEASKVYDNSNVAAQIRLESLQAIDRGDTTINNLQIKENESIGIELNKILRQPGSKYDLILQEGDVLSIPKQLETVRVKGELLYPITVRYDDNYSFKDYISFAGGTTDDSRLGKSYIVYANGSAARTRHFLWFRNYPKVDPGAEIFIPKRPDRRRLSAAEFVGLATSVGTLALIISQLNN